MDLPLSDVAWLAGLMEGEGSFMKGPPSSPNRPLCAIEITDEDVIARVARLWGVSYCAPTKAKDHHKQSYRASKRGRGAVEWMLALRPLMGARRRQQIDAALKSWQMKRPKVTYTQAEEMRHRRAAGERLVDIGTDFGVSGEYVRGVVRGVMHLGDRHTARAIAAVPAAHFWSLPPNLKLHWLAGYLEGEGHFRSSRVEATSVDRDVIERVAALVGGSISERTYTNPTWQDAAIVTVAGLPALNVMHAVHPFMGERRTEQIQAALDQGPDGDAAVAARSWTVMATLV